MPELIPPESLTSANSLLESTMRLTGLIGQGLGGLLFVSSARLSYCCGDGVSFLLSAVSELFIREPPRSHPVPHRTARPVPFLKRRLPLHRQRTGFRIYLVEASFANFFLASLTVGLPYYVEDVLHASPDWYGYIWQR